MPKHRGATGAPFQGAYIVKVGRIIVDERPDETLINIGPRKSENSIGYAVFSLAAAVGFYKAGSEAVAGRVPEGWPLAFIYFWMLCSLSFFLIGVFNALWNLWGHWQVMIREGVLTIHVELFRWQRTWTYERNAISSVRILETRGRGSLVMRTVAFEFNGKTKHATPNLTSSESDYLLIGPMRELISKESRKCAELD